MITLFIGSLPPSTTEESLTSLFSQYGTVRSIRLNSDIFTGKCRGTGLIQMEGHEARAAIAGLDGKTLEGSQIRVKLEQPRNRGHSRRHRH